jgi:hypothetical protein
MSVLARSCAALAVTALAAGVLTVAPAGVAAASRDGASAFGTTAQQPTSKKVRTPKRTTRGAAARAGGVVGNNMPLGAIPVKTGSVGTAIVPQGSVSIVKPVDTTGAETQPTSQTVRKPKRTTRGAAARAPRPDQTGTFVPFD